jgi:hypothetical protein
MLLRHVIVCLVIALGALVGPVAAPALARWGAPVSFGTGDVSNPIGVGVDQITGDVYVGNLLFVGNDEFDLSHSLVAPPSPFPAASGVFSGVAIDPVNHDVDVVNAEGQEIDIFDPVSGGLLSSFPVADSANLLGAYTAVQIATDTAGDVYVPNAPSNEIDVFNATGGAPSGVVATITGSGANALSAPTGVAVAPSGEVWVADAGNNRLEEFEPSGDFVTQIYSPGVGAVAVDEAGDVFASVHDSSGSHVIEYNAAGKNIDDFGLGIVGESSFATVNSIAIDNAHNVVYVADGGNNVVWAFVPAPEVLTGPVSNVLQTSATVGGSVDPAGGGSVTLCQFEYGTNTSYGHTTACLPATPYSSVTGVSTTLTDLAPSTTYHVRLAATNAHGTEYGKDESFTTFGPPAVEDESSFNTVTTSANVKAQVNPFGYETTCRVQYVEEAEFNASGYTSASTLPCSPSEHLGSAFGNQNVGATLAGLRVDTVYHYRFVAASTAGMVYGTDETLATFGIKSFTLGALGENSQPYTQAGGHPYRLTATFTFNTTTDQSGSLEATDANPKDFQTELPAGLIGNPEATPRCSPYEVAHADCSGASQVGMLKVYTARTPEGTESPVYNLVPPTGIAAQFGARFNGFVTAHIDAKIRTGGDYGVTSDALYVSAGEGITQVSLTFWGVPADKSHDAERYCPVPDKFNEQSPCASNEPPVPFLTNPTECVGPLMTTLLVDSWQEAGTFVHAASEMPGITGCDELNFTPKITVQPENTSADSPTGLKIDLDVPQNEDPAGVATPDLRDVVVTLPRGVTVNPSSASGLEGCSPAQIEMNGPEPADCPAGSKVGSVEIITPLLKRNLDGGVYLAKQDENPFHSLLALYIAVEDPQSGVVLKLAGKVTADPATGQLTTTFGEDPQLPFEYIKLNLFAGPRALLATPESCGTFTSSSQLTPWSAPESGQAASPSSSFTINSGCVTSFAPTFGAGTASNQAGSYSPFTLTLARTDADQKLRGVSVTLPQGLIGRLVGIPRCGEQQAQEGACPSGSLIGHATVGAGSGPDPYYLGGDVYLTGPYEGAPFGFSIVVPAVAGPFNLGNVIIGSKIEINRHTAQVLVTSDPLPQTVNGSGIPSDLRTVTVTIDRPAFTLNPTNCDALAVDGAITSAQGTTTAVSSRFQAANCANLSYKPGFAVSAGARFNRLDGASLTLKITPVVGQANTSKVRFVFPKQLPTRLSTLKLSCVAKVFEANPASCPTGSVVGTAVAHTPVLSSALTGPVYLVSHGGAEFPDAEIVLQGEGVTLVMDGKTDIVKGVTSSTFESVPDAPFSSFEARLSEGPHSVFAAVVGGSASGSLCGKSLMLGSILVGQNGIQLKRSTKIAVNGCEASKTAKWHGSR